MGWEVGEEGSEIVTDVYRHKCIYGCLLTAKRCVVFVLLLLLCVCMVLFVCFVLGVFVCLFVFYINFCWCNLLTLITYVKTFFLKKEEEEKIIVYFNSPFTCLCYIGAKHSTIKHSFQNEKKSKRKLTKNVLTRVPGQCVLAQKIHTSPNLYHSSLGNMNTSSTLLKHVELKITTNTFSVLLVFHFNPRPDITVPVDWA